MKKPFSFFLLLFFIASNTFAQDKSVVSLLKEYNLLGGEFLSTINISNVDYSFDALSISKNKQEATGHQTQNKREFTFNSRKPLGQKFTLISVDGKTPSKKDIKHFNKEKNSTKEQSKLILAEDNYFIEKNNEEELILGFNIPQEQITSNTAFMAHCTGYIYIDKTSKRINKIVIKSNEAFNLKLFHVTEMNITINIAYNDEYKQYYVSDEDTNMKVLVLGSITDFEIKEVYSNFKFIKK